MPLYTSDLPSLADWAGQRCKVAFLLFFWPSLPGLLLSDQDKSILAAKIKATQPEKKVIAEGKVCGLNIEQWKLHIVNSMHRLLQMKCWALKTKCFCIQKSIWCRTLSRSPSSCCDV